MTEHDWVSCEYPQTVLEGLGDSLTKRKFLLFCAACCGRMTKWYRPDLKIPEYVELVERYADELVPWEVVKHASAKFDVEWALLQLWGFHDDQWVERRSSADLCAWVVGELSSLRYWQQFSEVVDEPTREKGLELERVAVQQECASQALLLREIVGNPFRPATFDPVWRTRTAVSLARGMYKSRDFGAMPILADALQDAGCDNDDVLNHCRGPGPHVRGCWVVDLVLGKE